MRELEFKGAPEWFTDSPRDKAYGLGEVPITYDPPVSASSKLEFVRQEKADKPDYARCWLQKEPARKLPNVAKVPTLVLTSGGVLPRALRPLHGGLSQRRPASRRPSSGSTRSA